MLIIWLPSSDETNNSGLLSFSTTVPDLIIKSIACAPLNANVGDNVTITVKVENQGRDKALKPRLALSIDGSPMDYVDIPEINMGATATANFTWKATAGPHEISATADVDQTVLESNETNNTKSQYHNYRSSGNATRQTCQSEYQLFGQ